jgi:hypothetical protein
MRTVEGVDVGRVALEVGDEGEVAPLRPQRRLRSDQSGAAHDEPAPLVLALGYLGLSVVGVLDRGPGGLFDGQTTLTTAFTMRTPIV